MKQDFICVHAAGPKVGAVFLDKQPLAKRRSEWNSVDGTRHWIHPYYFKHKTLIPYVTKKAWNVGDKVSIRPDSDHYEETEVNPRCDVAGRIIRIDFVDPLPYKVDWGNGNTNCYRAEELFLREEFNPQEIDLTSLYTKDGLILKVGENHTLESRIDPNGKPYIQVRDASSGVNIPLGKIPNLVAALLEFM
jgi:hypothetical protein